MICRAGTVLSATPHLPAAAACCLLQRRLAGESRQIHRVVLPSATDRIRISGKTSRPKNILESITHPTKLDSTRAKKTKKTHLTHGLAHALAHNGPTSPTSSILMSPDRQNLLQRLDLLPATIRQRDHYMGCLHLLVEYLLECYSWAERYVSWRSSGNRCRGRGLASPDPRICCQGWMLIPPPRISRHNTRLARTRVIHSCELVVPSSRLHESWISTR